MIHLGLIGCGSIGSFLLRSLNREKRVPGFEITQIFDLESRGEHLKNLAAEFRCQFQTRLDSLLASDVELVLEAANPAAALEYGPWVLKAGKHLLLMSTGAMAIPAFAEEVARLSAEKHRFVLIPSGAIGGLDAVRAAMEGAVDGVTLTTRKPPAAIESPPGGAQSAGSPSPGQPWTVFEGTASEAIRLYPKNINVAVTLGLAALGPDRTRVRLVADPSIANNTHEVELNGAAGTMQLRFSNRPMADNPRTSALAAFSALSILRRFEAMTRGGVILG